MSYHISFKFLKRADGEAKKPVWLYGLVFGAPLVFVGVLMFMMFKWALAIAWPVYIPMLAVFYMKSAQKEVKIKEYRAANIRIGKDPVVESTVTAVRNGCYELFGILPTLPLMFTMFMEDSSIPTGHDYRGVGLTHCLVLWMSFYLSFALVCVLLGKDSYLDFKKYALSFGGSLLFGLMTVLARP